MGRGLQTEAAPTFTLGFRVHAKLLQSCDSVYPVDCSPPVSVQGILQARILEWTAMPSSGGSSNPGIKLVSLMFTPLAGRFFTISATWVALGEITVYIYCVCVCV